VDLLSFLTIEDIQNLLSPERLYIGMLLLLGAASLGAPIPEDIPLLLGGMFCRMGYGNTWIVIGIGLIGVLGGDFFLYCMGRKFGMSVLQMRLFRWMVTRDHITMMKAMFRRWGSFIIFFGRFFVGVRSVMCLTAGTSRVPMWKFVLIDVSGGLVTVPSLVMLGWLFSDSIEKISSDISRIEYILAGVVTAALIGWVIMIHVTRTRKKAIEKRFREKIGTRDFEAIAADDASPATPPATDNDVAPSQRADDPRV
jgi:membrane protein DedA with SNARE-associated domain